MSRAQVARLPGGRLHLNDGPIDLVIAAEGIPEAVSAAEAAAISRFETILDELCSELPLLRRQTQQPPQGVVARRMWEATKPFAADTFITPMAAVAGSVADEIVEAMTGAASLSRVFVNNGGDIAFNLAAGQSFRIGLVNRPDAPQLFADAAIHASDTIRGIATSGWRGRSFSLGIADAVTVLARNAAAADAAATLIANAVDCPGHPGIRRKPAQDIQPDSDLGARAVTTSVEGLSQHDVVLALGRGAALAQLYLDQKRIAACALHLAGMTRTLGHTAIESVQERLNA